MSARMLVAALLCAAATAQEKKDAAPRITATTPLRLIAGETQVLRLRGIKLKDTTEIRSTPALGVTVKERKDAAPPSGLEAKDVGDQELVAEVNVPADFTAKTIALELIAPAGTSAPREIPVVAKDAEVREKEPNNGFREAQPWDATKPLAGCIDGDKDVDVFRIEGRAGVPLAVAILAASAGSLLDAVLSIYDAGGRLLATSDDTLGSRDARLSITPKADGPLCLVVGDAHDRGGAWHEYRIELQP